MMAWAEILDNNEGDHDDGRGYRSGKKLEQEGRDYCSGVIWLMTLSNSVTSALGMG